MNSKVWTQPDFLLEFITLYKNRPCLWKVKNEDYTNRLVKDEAYNELLELCRISDPSVGIEFVKSKINSIRTSYRKELSKINKSILLGSSKIYVPKLWYFSLLDFLREQDGLAISKNSTFIPDEKDDVDEQSFEDVSIADEEEQRETETYSEQVGKGSNTYSNLPQITHDHSRVLNYRTNFGNKPKAPSLETKIAIDKEQDEFDALGICVTKKLRKMDRLQQLFAENLINKALFLGSMGQLSFNSDICPVNNCNTQNFPST